MPLPRSPVGPRPVRSRAGRGKTRASPTASKALTRRLSDRASFGLLLTTPNLISFSPLSAYLPRYRGTPPSSTKNRSRSCYIASYLNRLLIRLDQARTPSRSGGPSTRCARSHAFLWTGRSEITAYTAGRTVALPDVFFENSSAPGVGKSPLAAIGFFWRPASSSSNC